MKTTLLALATTTCAFSQGPLTPPAAPAPTMKTLSQMEPRTPLTGTGFVTISTSGNYYLTGDLLAQVQIQANDVTLDLNGFSIRASEGIGITSAAPRLNITICNGSVIGPGVWNGTTQTYSGNSGRGIIAYGNSAGNISGQNIRIENVTVRGFQQCISFASFFESSGGRGIISNCILRDFELHAISANHTLIKDTVVQSGSGSGVKGNFITTENLMIDQINGFGLEGDGGSHRGLTVRTVFGIGVKGNNFSLSGATVSGCTGDGINGTALQLENCNSSYNGGSGILTPDSTVKNCLTRNNGGAGIWADSSVISGCKVLSCGADGIRGVNSTISMCKSSGNDTNTLDGYLASGIVWNGGRQVDNVTDLYAPAAPAP